MARAVPSSLTQPWAAAVSGSDADPLVVDQSSFDVLFKELCWAKHTRQPRGLLFGVLVRQLFGRRTDHT